jgi:50S ribosome-binding GTPase
VAQKQDYGDDPAQDAGLRAAAAEAVTATLGPARKMKSDLYQVISVLCTQVDAGGQGGDGDETAELIASRLEALIRGRLDRVDTFNIVLLGRAGVGKSTLIEAIRGGGGSSISQNGFSDHTADGGERHWGSCRLYETTGSGGSAELRDLAHEAVLGADLVLVCFDTQAQDAAHFEELAGWVTRYRKPVIAVLNVLNPRWRFPPNVPTEASRRELSRSVAEHADDIVANLAAIGLHEVPVVAVHAMYAFFARADSSCSGQLQERARLIRSKAAGPETLSRWSNLQALENLLAEAVRTDAVGLRLGALSLEVQVAYIQAAGSLERDMRLLALYRADIVEQEIEQVLARLGAPEAVLDEQEPENVLLLNELRALERLRGSFRAPQWGLATEFAHATVYVALGDLRVHAHQRADMLYVNAEADGTDVSAKRFMQEVFVDLSIDAAAAGALRKVAEYLHMDDQLFQQNFTMKPLARLDQAAVAWPGQARNTPSDLWSRLMMTDVDHRIAALGRARALADSAVEAVFDEVQHATIEQAKQVIRLAFVTTVGPLVGKALNHRRAAGVAEERIATIVRARENLPHTQDALDVLRAAVSRCEERVLRSAPGQPAPAPAQLWLGESWFTNPIGLLERDPKNRDAKVQRSSAPARR